MPHVEIYSSLLCPYCAAACWLLGRKGVEYTLRSVDRDPEVRRQMMERASGRHTVPQIFIDDHHVGGYDELAALEARGELDALLSPAG